jgi:hypothetical protein
MAPSRHLIKSIFISIVVFFIIGGLIEGIWIFHAHLLTILWVELIIIGAVLFGLFICWLILRAIYPELRSNDIKPPVEPIIKDVSITVMNIEYELNTEDILAFSLYNYEHAPRLGRARRLIRRFLLFAAVLSLIIAIVLITAFGQHQILLAVVLCIIAVLMVLWYFFSSLVIRKILRGAIYREYGRKQNKLIGFHKLTITPDVIADITDMGESKTNWDAIEYVAYTEKYLFITIRASGPYIVPERAFKDKHSFQQFVELAQSYYQATKAKHQN